MKLAIWITQKPLDLKPKSLGIFFNMRSLIKISPLSFQVSFSPFYEGKTPCNLLSPLGLPVLT